MSRGRLLAILAAVGVAVTAGALHHGLRRKEPRAERRPTEVPDEAAVAPDRKATGTPREETAPRRSILGMAVDAADGRPIARATIRAHADGRIVTEVATDADGAFSLDVPEQRRYTLTAAAAGYVHSQIQSCWTAAALEAEPGAEVRIALERALRIRGTVSDQARRGLGGATLRSHSFYVELERGSVAYLVDASAATVATADALGRFEIGEVAARGQTTFLVSLEGYGDGVLRVDAATTAASSNHDVRLTALPALAGRVVGEDGRPLAGAALIPLGEVSGDVATAPPLLTTDAGTFRIAWRERASSLLVWALGCTPAIVAVRPHDLLRGTPFEVRLERAGEATGVVRDDQGLPVEGARVRVHHYEMDAGGLRGRLYAPPALSYSPEPGVDWYLLPKDPMGCVCVPEVATDAGGAFVLPVAGRGQVGTGIAVTKEGYVRAVSRWRDGSPPALVELVRAARVIITAFDARTAADLPRFNLVVVHPDAGAAFASNPAAGQPASAPVKPGTVRIEVEAAGYEKRVVEAVELSPAQEFTSRLALNPK